MSESRRDRFLRNKKKKQAAVAAKRKADGVSYDHPEYCILPSPGGALVRPWSDNDPQAPVELGDMRLFRSSFIKGIGESSKKFPVSWGFEPWYKHPLGELVSVIAKGKFDKANKTMAYDNAGHPLLKLILTNDEDTSITTGWKGNKAVLMNVIDRADDWCKENKHTKVLVKNATFSEQYQSWMSSYGVGPSITNGMIEAGTKKMVSIIDTDFIIYRYNSKKPKIEVGSKKIYYEVFMPEFDPQIFENPAYENIEHLKNIWSKEVMSDEEVAYGFYDFEKMPLYNPSSMTYILSRLKDTIIECDKEFPGHNWLENFLEISEDEKKEMAAAQKEELGTISAGGFSAEDDIEDDIDGASEQAEEEPVKQPEEKADEVPKRSRREAKTDGNDVDTSIYKGYDSLSEDEKAIVIVENGELGFDVEPTELDACTNKKQNCTYEFPISFNVCPKCNAKYK